MGNNDATKHALEQVLAALRDLSTEERERVVRTAITFYAIDIAPIRTPAGPVPSGSSRITITPGGPSVAGFSEERDLSPKEFMLQKQPRTDVERIACLAYYLTHYRSVQQFKTLDLSKLNTEAAQPKFANAAYAANNALKRGYLAPATKGEKQLSAAGEQFVQALPDRELAKKTFASFKPRRSARRRSRSEQPPSEES